jgi:hypothetical protein
MSYIRSLAQPPAAPSLRAAKPPPSAASNSRRPMVTVIRPSRARCVEGRIPRHDCTVLPSKEGRWASTSVVGFAFRSGKARNETRGAKRKYHRPQVTTAAAVAVCQSHKIFPAHFCLGHVLINAGIGRMSALAGLCCKTILRIRARRLIDSGVNAHGSVAPAFVARRGLIGIVDNRDIEWAAANQ